ncbi:MAG: endolytic transglycosylase MltG, partial [Clostridia bacterium]|nr:endolytic transglycosylase MltG [Clostridia bacterium]
SVFHNRLDTLNTGGMTIFGENINGTLGSDPTIYYPYKKNTAPSNFKGTYNTYDIHGLPPGPICNPGMEAIKAALYPEASNNYYFCHKAATEDSDAKAYYASTLGDHNYNLYLAGLR